MNKIEIAVIDSNKYDFQTMTVAMARMTQRGHEITNLETFYELLDKPYQDGTLLRMLTLPHGTIERFSGINVVIVGASRRFLAQITRHQTGVTFMSGSLQYSDYSDDASFLIPYDIIEKDAKCHDAGVESFEVIKYLNSCRNSLVEYKEAVSRGLDKDAAGYMMPQGMRNVLVMSANAEAWKHMIAQRTCNRNTKETQYVMTRILKELQHQYPIYFSQCGPPCCNGKCEEGNFRCGSPWYDINTIAPNSLPSLILSGRFPYMGV